MHQKRLHKLAHRFIEDEVRLVPQCDAAEMPVIKGITLVWDTSVICGHY
jgi:hypothetical protein